MNQYWTEVFYLVCVISITCYSIKKNEVWLNQTSEVLSPKFITVYSNSIILKINKTEGKKTEDLIH